MALNHGSDGQIVLRIATADSDSLPVGSIKFHDSAGVARYKIPLCNFVGSCVDFVTQSGIVSFPSALGIRAASAPCTGAAHLGFSLFVPGLTGTPVIK